MSEYRVETVRLGPVRKHPNADTLSITDVDGYPVIFRTGDFKEGDLATYISRDAMVPLSHPAFKFLDKGKGKTFHRVKAVRLRGVYSEGLLVPAIEGTAEGDKVAELYGIEKYQDQGDKLDRQPQVAQVARSKRKQVSWYEYGCHAWAAGLSIAILWVVLSGHLQHWLVGTVLFVLTMVAHRISLDNHRQAQKRPSYAEYDLDPLRKYSYLIKPDHTVLVTEKIHGCINRLTRVWMADGSRKGPTEINIGDEVLGMNESGQLVATKVLNKFENGTTTEWLKIICSRENAGRGDSTVSITVTPDHRFYDPTIGDYIEARYLRAGSHVSVCRTDAALTPLQVSIMIGKMLGDGSLHTADSGSAAVVFGHAVKDKEYLEWTMRGLGELGLSARRTRQSGYGSHIVGGSTVYRREISECFRNWMVGNKKTIPSDLQLNPISLAFWYMDDGSLSHSDGQEDRASIATCGFTENDCDVLIGALHKLGLVTKKKQYDGYWRLTFDSINAEKLFLLVAPYIPISMQRKLPERYRGHSGWLPKDEQFKPSFVTNQVLSVEPCDPAHKTRYDIETETHNYVAHGVLVHNCNASYHHNGKRFHVKSRTVFRGDTNDVYWRVAKKYDLERKLRKHPSYVLFGEIYGRGIQDLEYGKHEPEFVAFDVLDLSTGKFLDVKDLLAFCSENDIPHVPILYYGPYVEEVRELAEGQSCIEGANHCREGVVIRTNDRSVCLKYVGQGYLLR